MSTTPKTGETVRLVGEVREVSAPGPAVYELRIGKQRLRRETHGAFVVEVDGQRVRVDASDAVLAGGAVETDGAYGDLATQAGGGFSPEAAPSFAEATLSASVLQPGDQVELYGKVIELAAVDGAGYREATARTLGELRASVVARGPHAKTEMDRALAQLRAKEPRDGAGKAPLIRGDRPPLADWMTSGVCVLAGVIVLGLDLWLRRGMWPGTFALAVTAIAGPPGLFERYHARGGKPRDTAILIEAMAILCYVMGFFFVAVVYASAWGQTLLALALMGTILVSRLLSQRDARAHRAIATTAPWQGQVGARVLVVGTVVDSSPVPVGRNFASLVREIRDHIMPSGSHAIDDAEFRTSGTFEIQTAVGSIDLDSNDLLWTSSVRETICVDKRNFLRQQYVPVGGAIAAVGWVEEGAAGRWRLRPRGTMPVVVLATEAHGDPCAVATRMARRQRVTVTAMGVLAAALLVVAFVRA